MAWVSILNLLRVGLSRGRERVVYWCTPLFLPFTFSLFGFLSNPSFFSFWFFFFKYSFCFLFFHFYLFSPPPYHYSWLPLFIPFSIVGFTLFVPQPLLAPYGYPLALHTSLPAGQPLSLLRVCWLHHSPFLDKITCLVSYLSLFLFFPCR